MNLPQEFDRQVETLIQKQYPQSAGMSEKEFNTLLNPLKKPLTKLNLPDADLKNGTLPFVIVVKSALVDTETAMSRVSKDGRRGITKLFPHVPSDFEPIASVAIPPTNTYLLLDIDRGKSTINIPPVEALTEIVNARRSPLTIDEGVAILTHYPEFLMKNNCFSLLASRHTGDQRVPAVWINSNKNPNLGWCWDGNPHTWLGSASCKSRF